MNAPETLRRYLLWPTREEWKKWSRPTKIGFLGFWIGIPMGVISLYLGLIPFVFPPLSYQEAEKQLNVAHSKKDWPALSLALNEVRKHREMDDLYNFYSGVLALETTGNLTPPHEYFEKIPPGSPYFLRGQTGIYDEAARGRWLSDQEASLRIIKNLDRVGMRMPIYYLAQLKAQTNPTYDWLSSTYKEMEGRLFEYMDFTSFSPAIHSTVGIPVNYDLIVHHQTRAVAFLFLINMIIAGKNENSITRCTQGKVASSKLIESNGIESVEMGMRFMSQNGASKLLSAASAIQCKTE